MISVTLHNKGEIRAFRKNIATLKSTLVEAQATLLRKQVELQIIEAIQKRMHDAGFSQKIIDNTFIDNMIPKGKRVRVVIKSEYYSDDNFDVAKAREDGTKDHKITPHDKEDGTPGTLAFVDNGIQKFSKGHEVSGMPRLQIVKSTVKQFSQAVQDEYDRQLGQFLSEQTGGKL